ncbi:hypothetical protein HG530_005683 [Fusarium avenaceum]|nr:hypothetical protein HG530_005683 [Fusarium avenaceum]
MSDGLLTPLSHESSSKTEQLAADTTLDRSTTENPDLPRKPTANGSKLSQALQVLEDGLEQLRKHSTKPSENINRRIELIQDLMAEANPKDGAESRATSITTSIKKHSEEAICQVRRLTMDQWKKGQVEPRYVINAYYRTPSMATHNHVNGPVSGFTDHQERPERVAIPSRILCYELERIADISLESQSLVISESIEKRTTEEPALPTETGTGLPPLKPEDQDMKTDGQSKRTKELVVRIQHLRLLKNFIQNDLAKLLDLNAKIASGTLEKIAFENLWYLFSPGDILYSKNRGHDQVSRAWSVTGGQKKKRARRKSDDTNPPLRGDKWAGNYVAINSTPGTWSTLTIDFYTMAFDGTQIGPVDGRVRIKNFAGERRITELPVYPLRFHDQRENLARQLVERGRKYFFSYGHKSYSGLTCPPGDDQLLEEVNGDVFIDFKDYYRTMSNPTFQKDRARSRPPQLGLLEATEIDLAETEEEILGITWYHTDAEVDFKATDEFMALYQNDLDTNELGEVELSDEQLQLFTHIVPAYIFRTRRYVQLNVDLLSEIDKSDKARDDSFEDLVIPESHRSLLTGLVKSLVVEPKVQSEPQSSDKGLTQIDLVRGKGRGLIILLHGPPGSGKTSTAETLAAYTRRPLYPITCGDLGTSPEKVEAALVEHTERAQRWGCILLLDEADVFLSRRDWRNTEHNALVSVFLRQLEYYSGILFLTTNRVGVIDEAFKSRVHENETAAIKIKFDRKALLKFASQHYETHKKTDTSWNGRQIRNAFQLAIALGHHDRERSMAQAQGTKEDDIVTLDKKWRSVRLTIDNFRNIAKTARDFEDYLSATRGNDSHLAKQWSLRYDDQTEDLAVTQVIGVRKDYGAQRKPKMSQSDQRSQRSISRNDERGSSRSQRYGKGSKQQGEEEQEGVNDEGEEVEYFEEFSSDDD